MNSLVVIMGVSGAGKSAVSAALAARTGWALIEGDDHHSAENVALQASGTPLTNAHRINWIDSMAQAVSSCDMTAPVILACSALNAFVRDRLAQTSGRPCVWIWLDVPETVLQRRMKARADHFMPASLLASQLAALSPPDDAIRIDGALSIAEMCETIRSAL